MLVKVDYVQFSIFVNYLNAYYQDELSIVKRDSSKGVLSYYLSSDDKLARLVAKSDDDNLEWYVKDLY